MSTARVHLAKGKALYEQQALIDALTEFRAVLDRYDDIHPEALYYAGEIEARLGRYEDARGTWTRLLSVVPDHAGAREGLARLPTPRTPADDLAGPPPLPPSVTTEGIERTFAWIEEQNRQAQERLATARYEQPAEAVSPPVVSLWRNTAAVRSATAFGAVLLAALATGLSFRFLGLGLGDGRVSLTVSFWQLLLVLPVFLAVQFAAHVIYLWAVTLLLFSPTATLRNAFVTYCAIFFYQVGGYAVAAALSCFGALGMGAACLVVLLIVLIRPVQFIAVGMELGEIASLCTWFLVNGINLVLLYSLLAR